MDKLSASDDPGSRGGGAFLTKQLLPYLAPMAFVFACVLALMSLAYYNRSAMEVLATALFYSANVYCVWVPIRDTAAMSILQGSRCDQLKMFMLLLFIPGAITFVFLSSVIATESGSAQYYAEQYTAVMLTGAAGEYVYVPLRDNFDLVIEFFGVLMTFLAVPLYLYYLRVKISRNLEKRGRVTKQKVSFMARAATAS